MSIPRLLVTVQRSTFTKSPWDSYVKIFLNEEEFLLWWTSLSLKSYTRTKAIVRIWDIDLKEERKDLIMPELTPRDLAQ